MTTTGLKDWERCITTRLRHCGFDIQLRIFFFVGQVYCNLAFLKSHHYKWNFLWNFERKNCPIINGLTRKKWRVPYISTRCIIFFFVFFLFCYLSMTLLWKPPKCQTKCQTKKHFYHLLLSSQQDMNLTVCTQCIQLKNNPFPNTKDLELATL